MAQRPLSARTDVGRLEFSAPTPIPGEVSILSQARSHPPLQPCYFMDFHCIFCFFLDVILGQGSVICVLSLELNASLGRKSTLRNEFI